MGNKVKIIGTILGIFSFALLIMGMTYAWFTWRSSNIDISGTSECFTINSVHGSSISQTINDVGVILFDESKIISDNMITIKEGMGLTYFTASINSGCTITGDLTVTLNINTLNDAFTNDGNSTGAFKYVLASYDPSAYTTVSITALSGKKFEIIKTDSITTTDSITLIDEELSTTTKGYLIIFYIDGDLANNDAGGTTFSGTLNGVATQTVS